MNNELKKASESKSLRKIIDKIELAQEEKRPFYSFEFFPPKTSAGVRNLYARLDRMSTLEPMFMDVTWGAGGSTSELTMDISTNAQNLCSSDVMMHLTCTNMKVEDIKAALDEAKARGLRNILALRGDPPKGTEEWTACSGGFCYAVDLVKYIRENYGDYFGIGVAGYPEKHSECDTMENDMKYLKEKIDAGADFVITQLFYDVDLFLDWVNKCRDLGITVPILPGIMPIQNYSGFKRMTGFCKTAIPPEIESSLEPIKDDDAAVKAYGIKLAVRMCRQLLEAGLPGLHFYTLNLERSVTEILKGLGFVTTKKTTDMPWLQSQSSRRCEESVRPIFWANRPKSYLDRTTGWDDFPNGRWGDASSPAYGDLSDYHLCSFKTGTKEERQEIWSTPSNPKDVWNVFVQYIDGTVPRLPWCENAIMLETRPLKESLKQLNAAGLLTINSQPRVNGVPSSDPAVGWGGPDGIVYQKAYLEFFCSRSNLEKFQKMASEHKSLTYTAIDMKGTTVTNIPLHNQSQVNAVTWGVFPNQEVMQPTVVDAHSFKVWRDEAFMLWKSQWQSIYEEGSTAWNVIQEIYDNYFLVNVVDNNFINGDIFAALSTILN